MAKKSADDLDAELAALEAELASLSGKKPEKKSRLPSLRKKPETATPPPAAAPAPEASRPPPPPPPAPPAAPEYPVTDASVWRQEGEAWVRTVPTQARIVRRILDEDGNTVREEVGEANTIDNTPEVKAERGVGKLFGRFKK